MADNTTLNPGSGGNVVATDDIGDVHYQRVKLTLGADGVSDGDVSSTNPIPTAPVNRLTLTDKSGTITTGGTAQTLMASNTSRKGWMLQNNSGGNLWFNELGSTAVQSQPSIRLSPGESYTSIEGTSTAAISIIGATTGQTFSAREW